MTSLPLVIHPGVDEDLLPVLADYESFDPALPDRLRSRIDEQLDRIEMWPDSGAILFESFRRALLKRFPFMLILSR